MRATTTAASQHARAIYTHPWANPSAEWKTAWPVSRRLGKSAQVFRPTTLLEMNDIECPARTEHCREINVRRHEGGLHGAGRVKHDADVI